MDNGKISVRYARALFQLAQEQGCEEAIYEGLMGLTRNYLLALAQFNEVLSDPIVAKEEKVKLLEMAIGEPMHDILKQFIAFVVEQHRESRMFLIAMKYMEMYRKKHNILNTQLTTATELPETTLNKIKAYVEQTFNVEAEMEIKIDPALIGGFVLDIENTRMDASVAGQLKALKNKLK